MYNTDQSDISISFIFFSIFFHFTGKLNPRNVLVSVMKIINSIILAIDDPSEVETR